MPIHSSGLFQLTAPYIEYLHDEIVAVVFAGKGSPPQAHDCRDLNLLQSAPKQPFQVVCGVECYPTIYDKAACLFFSIIANHIFRDGCKRTAVLAVDQFLLANGFFLTLTQEEVEDLAMLTADYKTNGYTTEAIREHIINSIRDATVPLADVEYLGLDLDEGARAIREHLLNQPDAKLQQTY